MKAASSPVVAIVTGLMALAETAAADEAVRIGVYDSRSVAIAFVGSEVYQKTRGKLLASKMGERRRAKEEGNRKKVAELEAWGKAQQERLHQQGFSTAPVDDILALIKDRLPAIRKEARVEHLVSKWDRETLQGLAGAEQVDVTMQLIEAFEPNEKQKKSAVEIQKHEPVPLEEMKNHDHSPPP